MMRVGFIGLGNVGGKLSGSLLRNGIDLTVHDLNDDLVSDFVSRGAKRTDGPAALMRDCDAVITCLPSPAASAAVMDEMLPEITEGKIWMEMSTTDEAEVTRLGAMVMDRGGAAVDCPVSGGCHRAATGNISIFAGCDRATFDRIAPFLKTMGRRILHTGDLGSASILKVVTNYLATANLITCCEALVTAKAAGMGLTVDAEEAERLDLSLDVVEAVLRAPSLAGWDGFGVAVQAYGPRAVPVIDWLYDLAIARDRRLARADLRVVPASPGKAERLEPLIAARRGCLCRRRPC